MKPKFKSEIVMWKNFFCWNIKVKLDVELRLRWLSNAILVKIEFLSIFYKFQNIFFIFPNFFVHIHFHINNPNFNLDVTIKNYIQF